MLPPRLRSILLTGHVVFSVGWLGAVAAYLALAIHGLWSPDATVARAAYLAMGLVGFGVIVPSSLAAWASGVVLALGTRWGLFRHYWVLAKFVLATGATLILLQHMRTAVTRMTHVAEAALLSADNFGTLRTQLVVHAAGGLLVLIVTTALSVLKPGGMTLYGRRRAEKERAASREAS